MDFVSSESQTIQRPIFNIAGEKVLLGPPTCDLVQIVVRWENDFAVTLLSGDSVRPKMREAAEAKYERYTRGEQHDWAGFVIYETATLRPIGVTDLRHIDCVRRTAEFGICIGEQDCWGKGSGTETTRLMLDYGFTYGFTALGIHNIMLTSFSYNERAIRAYQRAGFLIIDRRREAHRIGDRVYDIVYIVYMDCLGKDFQSPPRHVVALP
jgi:RimJ/RimL family protein N-acetyltransferase